MSTTLRLLQLDLATDDGPLIAARLAHRSPAEPFDYVVTPNADHFVRIASHPVLRTIYDDALLRVLDSRVVARAGRLMGVPVPPVVTGVRLTTLLLARHVRRGERVTIIGLRPVWVPRLMARWGLAPPAHYDPPAGFERDPRSLGEAVEFVVRHPSRFVFLAVGSPRQEILAAAIKATGRATGTGLCIGAGLDYLAGAVTRAPLWMREAGLEWLHRLLGDPRRLARRYLIDCPPIFALLLRERLRGQPPPAAAYLATPAPANTNLPAVPRISRSA